MKKFPNNFKYSSFKPTLNNNGSFNRQDFLDTSKIVVVEEPVLLPPRANVDINVSEDSFALEFPGVGYTTGVNNDAYGYLQRRAELLRVRNNRHFTNIDCKDIKSQHKDCQPPEVLAEIPTETPIENIDQAHSFLTNVFNHSREYLGSLEHNQSLILGSTMDILAKPLEDDSKPSVLSIVTDSQKEALEKLQQDQRQNIETILDQIDTMRRAIVFQNNIETETTLTSISENNFEQNPLLGYFYQLGFESAQSLLTFIQSNPFQSSLVLYSIFYTLGPILYKFFYKRFFFFSWTGTNWLNFFKNCLNTVLLKFSLEIPRAKIALISKGKQLFLKKKYFFPFWSYQALTSVGISVFVSFYFFTPNIKVFWRNVLRFLLKFIEEPVTQSTPTAAAVVNAPPASMSDRFELGKKVASFLLAVFKLLKEGYKYLPKK